MKGKTRDTDHISQGWLKQKVSAFYPYFFFLSHFFSFFTDLSIFFTDFISIILALWWRKQIWTPIYHSWLVSNGVFTRASPYPELTDLYTLKSLFFTLIIMSKANCDYCWKEFNDHISLWWWAPGEKIRDNHEKVCDKNTNSPDNILKRDISICQSQAKIFNCLNCQHYQKKCPGTNNK